MKKIKIHYIFTILACALVISCSGASGPGTFLSPSLVAVDSTNDRVFIVEDNGKIFAYQSSTLEGLGDQPALNDDDDLFALLPSAVSHTAVVAQGSRSRVFIMGSILDDSGARVLNRIRVLDFDGLSFSEASFSPIIISDGDDSTDDTDNSFSAILVDEASGRLYVSDLSAGLVHILDVSDGSAAFAPIVIPGEPQGLGLASNHLFVCNTSEVPGEQIITVVNATDFTTTQIDLGLPCRQLAVQGNSSGVVLVVKNDESQSVLIQSVDTTTFAAASPISSSTEGIANGELNTGAGVSSSILTFVIGRTSSDNIVGYFGEQDGNIKFIDIQTDLSSFSTQTLATSVSGLADSVLQVNADGDGVYGFMVAGSGAFLAANFGSTEIDILD